MINTFILSDYDHRLFPSYAKLGITHRMQINRLEDFEMFDYKLFRPKGYGKYSESCFIYTTCGKVLQTGNVYYLQSWAEKRGIKF